MQFDTANLAEMLKRNRSSQTAGWLTKRRVCMCRDLACKAEAGNAG